MAFWLRDQSAGTAKFGLALSTAAIATVIGNASASRIRRFLKEEQMLLGALAMAGVAGLAAALIGGIPAMIGLAFVANLAASIGRLGFEAMLQRDAPDANRGRAFAMFETRFQLSWAAAGLIPVVIEMSGPTGALVIGLTCAAASLHAAPPSRAPGPSRRPALHLRTVIAKTRLRRRAATDHDDGRSAGSYRRRVERARARACRPRPASGSRRSRSSSGSIPPSPARSTTPCTNALPRAT